MIEYWNVLAENSRRVTTESLKEDRLYVALAPVSDRVHIGAAFAVEILRTYHSGGTLMVSHHRYPIIECVGGLLAVLLTQPKKATCAAFELGLVLGQPHPFVCVQLSEISHFKLSTDPYFTVA